VATGCQGGRSQRPAPTPEEMTAFHARHDQVMIDY